MGGNICIDSALIRHTAFIYGGYVFLWCCCISIDQLLQRILNENQSDFGFVSLTDCLMHGKVLVIFDRLGNKEVWIWKLIR